LLLVWRYIFQKKREKKIEYSQLWMRSKSHSWDFYTGWAWVREGIGGKRGRERDVGEKRRRKREWGGKSKGYL
jgi:hypothetical protein